MYIYIYIYTHARHVIDTYTHPHGLEGQGAAQEARARPDPKELRNQARGLHRLHIYIYI